MPALLMLELVSKEGRSLAELMAEFRSKYFISGEINSEVADQEAKMREIEERYSDGEIGHLDGVSVDYPDWHFNVRPSNTEPLLRLNLESLDLPRAHGGEARRGAGPDSLVTHGRDAGRGLAADHGRGHPGAADPDPLPGRPRQHLPARGTSRSRWSTPAPTPARRWTSWSASSRRWDTGSRISSW